MASYNLTIPPNEDRGPRLLAMYWTECIIVVIVVALRFYSRIKIKGLGQDDWIILFTLVGQFFPVSYDDRLRKNVQILVLVLAGLATSAVAHGGSRHLYYLHASDISSVLKLNWMIQPFGIMALATAKISVAFTMLRIISSANVWRRRFLYFCIISIFLSSAIAAILTFVQCNPPRALWTFVPGATCWDPRVQTDYAIFTASMNILSSLMWISLSLC